MPETNFTVEMVDINLLKPSEYNPRKLNKQEEQNLDASIDNFGMVEPIIANKAPGRENIIIGGHQRFFRLKKRGWKQVPVHYVEITDIEKERELNLRLNRNLGQWDYNLLSQFDKMQLASVGFSDSEVAKIFPDEKTEADVEFTEELNEEHNYIVLYFDNQTDWLNLQSLYPLKTVKSLDSKPGFEKRGVGRVVKGADFINKLMGGK